MKYGKLPLVLVSRWPSEDFVKKYGSREQALRARMDNAQLINKQIHALEKKVSSGYTKQDKKQNKEVLPQIRTREKWLDDIIKEADHGALLMASFSKSEYRDRGAYFKSIQEAHAHSVILRGIASARIMDAQKKLGLDTWFIETGYFGNYPGLNNPAGKKIWHRVVKNSMQHQDILDVPEDRWKKLVRYDPNLEYRGWRSHRGQQILVVAPSTKPCEYYGINRDNWVNATVSTLKKFTNRPITIREKASRSQRVHNSIYDAFCNDVWAVVTYNSIAAVEATQFGIPAFALADTAATPLINNDLSRIDNPQLADESLVYKWLCSLAYGQFSLEEMVNGSAWRTLMRNELRSKINF